MGWASPLTCWDEALGNLGSGLQQQKTQLAERAPKPEALQTYRPMTPGR